MKRFSWKKLMSLVVALALVVGVLHFGTSVSADETPTANAVGSIAKDEEGNEIDAIVYSMDREAVNNGVPGIVDLVLIIDNSNSMRSNNRLDSALTAAENFYNSLGNNVNKTIIELSKTPSVVNDFKRDTFDKAYEGFGSPIGTSFDLAQSYLTQTGLNRQPKNPTIVIFTDGEANNETDTNGKITSAYNNNIKIYSINYATGRNNVFISNALKSYVTNVSASSFSAADLAAAFNEVLDYIRTDAVDARIVAKLGDFVRYTGNVENVTYDVAANTITWDIPDNTTDELEDKLTTPNLDFQIVFPVTDDEGKVTLITDPTEVAKALVDYNKENPTDDQVKVDYDAETGKYTITVNVEAPNAVKLIYKVGEDEITKDVNTQNTLKKVFFEGPLTTQWTVKYFVDGELKYTDDDIIREYGVEFDPTEDEDYQVVEVSMLGENEGEYATDDYDDVISLSTQDPFTWIVVYTKKTSTVKFIDEFQALEDEGELPVTVQEETKAVGTQLLFPEDPRPDYVDAEGIKQVFAGWALKHADSAVIINADGIEVETDEVVGYDLVSANDYPAYTTSDITFYAYYEPEEVTVAILYRYAADNSTAADTVVKKGAPGETYSVNSPAIGGFTARTAVVSGTFKEDDEIVVYYDKNEPVTPPSDPTPSPYIPPIIIVTPTPSPVPTEVPTEAPTPIPTEVPTEEPTPTPEPVVEVEEPETPEGDVEIDEIETPEGAPEEEELDVEPIDTPQGDLPKTGVLPTYAFIGIGAACVLFGSILVIKRRKEEN